MPKVSTSQRSKLDSYVKEFGREVLSTDGHVLLCKVCEREVKADRKFLVSQHLGGAKHKALLDKKKESSSSSATQMIPFLQASGKKSQFNLELCEAFLSADIALRKLDNPKLAKFLEKWTKQQVPASSTVRLGYIKSVYDEKVDMIRCCLKDKAIWISIDESTDACGRAIAHTIVGALDGTDRRNFLLNVEHLEKTNSSTIAQAFINSLTVLWPTGIRHDQVFLFLSDGAAYMRKAGSALKVIFSRMLHVTCAAHGTQRVSEQIRSLFTDVNDLVTNGKKIFIKSSARKTIFAEIAAGIPLPPEPVTTRWGTWVNAALYYAKHLDEFRSVVEVLDSKEAESIREAKAVLRRESLTNDLAYIASHFACLPVGITRLEEKGASLVDSFESFDNLLQDLKKAPGAPGEQVSRKCDWIVKKNPDLSKLRAIAEVLRGNPCDSDVTGFSASELACFKYAPITSADAERSFSRLKNILSDRRQSFTVENLKMVIVINCNQ